VATAIPSADAGKAAVRALRAARRRHIRDNLQWVDALYRAYLLGVGAVAATLFLSGVLGDKEATAATTSDIAAHAPALLGCAVAAVIAGGLRSGARGGPLVIEAADVQHLLLAPVDRGFALRGVVLRQVRTQVFFGVVIGAVIGNLAFRRLPGEAAPWVIALAGFCALGAVAFHSTAVVASGRRLDPLLATVIGAVVVAWSAVDFLAHLQTSPATWAGRLALLPLTHPPTAYAGAAVAVALTAATFAVGLAGVGGTSLERALRRAELTAVLRFAVTVGDLRAVVLLRRQLAAELPRHKPWFKVRGKRYPVWRRGWQSFARWPGVRVARVLILGLVAGAAAAGAWDTTPLIAVTGFALLLVAFDAAEPYAQEVDHPTRRDSLPVEPRALARRHLAAPLALMAGVGLIGCAAALAIDPNSRALTIGAATLIPAALAPLAGAAFSIAVDPYAWITTPQLNLPRQAAPFVIALLGGAPVVAARLAARAHKPYANVAVNAAVAATLLSVALLALAESQIAKRPQA
jgi:hypothetical protein